MPKKKFRTGASYTIGKIMENAKINIVIAFIYIMHILVNFRKIADIVKKMMTYQKIGMS